MVRKIMEGKDKLESLLRLFISLGLISKLNGFEVCKGNFNNGTINKVNVLRDCFYQDEKKISLKDKGDKSDLTLMKEDTILLVSSKNNKKQKGVGCYDIHQLVNIFNEKYGNNNNKLKIGLCTRNKLDLIEKAYSKRQISHHLMKVI